MSIAKFQVESVRKLRDKAQLVLSGLQNYDEGEISFRELLDWLEIDVDLLAKTLEDIVEKNHDLNR